MIGYVRPPVHLQEFRDDHGRVIPYGARWADQDGDGPPETYSITRHPERFQPLVDVTRAILEHLTVVYDVERRETATGIELRPADPTAAPLHVELHDQTWVEVRAGVAKGLVEECGCDHCDADVLDLIDDLEHGIDAVIAGGLSEWLNEGERHDPDDLFVVHELRGTDGTPRSAGSTAVDDAATRQALRAQYAAVPYRWSPWRLRSR